MPVDMHVLVAWAASILVALPLLQFLQDHAVPFKAAAGWQQEQQETVI